MYAIHQMHHCRRRSWVYEYGVVFLQQSNKWRSKNEPKPKTPKFTEGTESHPGRSL